MSAIRTVARLAGLGLIAVGAGCGEPQRSVPGGGSAIAVLFDERHGLEGGELVRLHAFDIGVVETVDLFDSRVRATVRLAPEALENLTVATTFIVDADDGERYLETYVLDPDAERLTEGATLDGADGSIELMAMRASAAAGSLADDARASEWWDKAAGFVDDLKKEFDATDWTEEEKELRERWEQALEQMDEAVEEGQEALSKNVDELVKELEEAGRSDEARKLKERFEEFLNELR